MTCRVQNLIQMSTEFTLFEEKDLVPGISIFLSYCKCRSTHSLVIYKKTEKFRKIHKRLARENTWPGISNVSEPVNLFKKRLLSVFAKDHFVSVKLKF